MQTFSVTEEYATKLEGLLRSRLMLFFKNKMPEYAFVNSHFHVSCDGEANESALAASQSSSNDVNKYLSCDAFDVKFVGLEYTDKNEFSYTFTLYLDPEKHEIEFGVITVNMSKTFFYVKHADILSKCSMVELWHLANTIIDTEMTFGTMKIA
jgi:hypothetical protein